MFFYDYKTPTTFEEHFEFNYHLPYSVRIKRFATEDIVPLHYAETIEILLCNNLTGEITIDNLGFSFAGQSAICYSAQNRSFKHK